jgi:hypothetical protein
MGWKMNHIVQQADMMDALSIPNYLCVAEGGNGNRFGCGRESKVC